MPYSDDDRAIVTSTTLQCLVPFRKGVNMDNPNQAENQTGTELVTESLVEEVSIDGMCGVY